VPKLLSRKTYQCFCLTIIFFAIKYHQLAYTGTVLKENKLTTEITKEFDQSLHEVGLPDSRSLIGRQIFCKTSDGQLITNILSASDSNDDGFIELAVSPVHLRGDLVTHIIFGVNLRRVRTTFERYGKWVKDSFSCEAHIL
jgi:hypothetical protein